jgi:hypothetical protein
MKLLNSEVQLPYCILNSLILFFLVQFGERVNVTEGHINLALNSAVKDNDKIYFQVVPRVLERFLSFLKNFTVFVCQVIAFLSGHST